jgi:hypothetical protein
MSATRVGDYAWGTGTSTTVYSPAQVHGYTAYRAFFVDGTGHIYRWSWRGL